MKGNNVTDTYKLSIQKLIAYFRLLTKITYLESKESSRNKTYRT